MKNTGAVRSRVSVIRPNCQWSFQTIHEEWYAYKVTRVLDDGQDLESIRIDFKLSTVKSLHVKWVMETYNHMISSIGKDIRLKGWKKNGIQEALENGLEDNLDTFKNIDPIETADKVSNNLFVINKMYITQQNLDDDDSDCKDDDGNIFDVFIVDDEGDN